MKILEAIEDHYGDIAALPSCAEELYLVHPNGTFPWDVDQLKALAADGSDLTVAVKEDKVIAFANLYDVIPGKSAFIGNVIVDTEHRGQGVGKAVVERLVDICQKQYQAIPNISVFSVNESALLMYASMGFMPSSIEERQDPEGNRVDLIHMEYLKQ